MHTLLVLVLSASALLGQETLFSGPQPGEELPPLSVMAVNGPRAGKIVHYVSEFGLAPVLIVFMHQLDRNVQRNVWPLERFAADRAHAGLRSLVVFLNADRIEGQRMMRHWLDEHGDLIPIAVSIDGIEGPGSYGLNKNVAVTAILAHRKKVVFNRTIVQPGYSEAVKIIAAAVPLVGGEVPDEKDFLYGPGNGNRTLPLPANMPSGFLYGPARVRSSKPASKLKEDIH